MLQFRSEIRNSPTQQTIKIFLSDVSIDSKIKAHLDYFEEIKLIEIRDSIGRNRVSENITIFLKDNVDINKMKDSIDSSLKWYFEKESNY